MLRHSTSCNPKPGKIFWRTNDLRSCPAPTAGRIEDVSSGTLPCPQAIVCLSASVADGEIMLQNFDLVSGTYTEKQEGIWPEENKNLYVSLKRQQIYPRPLQDRNKTSAVGNHRQSSSPSKIALALAYFSRRFASCSTDLFPHPANRVSSELWAKSASLTFTATGLSRIART